MRWVLSNISRNQAKAISTGLVLRGGARLLHTVTYRRKQCIYDQTTRDLVPTPYEYPFNACCVSVRRIPLKTAGRSRLNNESLDYTARHELGYFALGCGSAPTLANFSRVVYGSVSRPNRCCLGPLYTSKSACRFLVYRPGLSSFLLRISPFQLGYLRFLVMNTWRSFLGKRA